MSKGFTLVELLIVIAVLAILATVVVLVINPAEILRESRDGQRLSDMATMRDAINFYMARVSSPDLDGGGACGTNCWVNVAASGTCDGRYNGETTETVDADRTVDGNGWIPINFAGITGGSPLSVLPVDPSNSQVAGDSNDLIYSYACGSGSTYELNAVMESTRYSNGGSDDVESNTSDGGDDANVYEVGNDPGLDV